MFIHNWNPCHIKFHVLACFNQHIFIYTIISRYANDYKIKQKWKWHQSTKLVDVAVHPIQVSQILFQYSLDRTFAGNITLQYYTVIIRHWISFSITGIIRVHIKVVDFNVPHLSSCASIYVWFAIIKATEDSLNFVWGKDGMWTWTKFTRQLLAVSNLIHQSFEYEIYRQGLQIVWLLYAVFAKNI